MVDDDWCELCGSEGCQGECQDEPVGESPGARLERLDRQERDKLQAALEGLIMDKCFPTLPLDLPSVEEFERDMARRPKVVLMKRSDGTTYRKRVPR